MLLGLLSLLSDAFLDHLPRGSTSDYGLSPSNVDNQSRNTPQALSSLAGVSASSVYLLLPK